MDRYSGINKIARKVEFTYLSKMSVDFAQSNANEATLQQAINDMLWYGESTDIACALDESANQMNTGDDINDVMIGRIQQFESIFNLFQFSPTDGTKTSKVFGRRLQMPQLPVSRHSRLALVQGRRHHHLAHLTSLPMVSSLMFFMVSSNLKNHVLTFSP